MSLEKKNWKRPCKDVSSLETSLVVEQNSGELQPVLLGKQERAGELRKDDFLNMNPEEILKMVLVGLLGPGEKKSFRFIFHL